MINVMSVIRSEKNPSIGLYAADDEEMPTKKLCENLLSTTHSRVFFPKIMGEELRFFEISNWRQLEKGKYGLLSPSTCVEIGAHSLDVLIVPGRAFDYFGRRLGRGGGYYDRVLRSKRPRLVVGYAFDFQLVTALVSEYHDQKVDRVITEKRILYT